MRKMQDNLTKHSVLNAGSSFLIYVVRIVVGFVVNPILVTGLGGELFGIWQICQRYLTYVESAEGRATQALKWVLANGQVTTDDQEKRRSVGSAITIWMMFLPIVALAGAAVVWLGPRLIRGLDPAMLPLARITCAILVLRLMLMGMAQVPEAILQGLNLGYRMTVAKVVAEIVGGALLAAAVLLHLGLIGLAVAFSLAVFMSGAINHFNARRDVPWYGVARPARDDVRKFFGFSAWVFSWTLVNKLVLFSDVVIIGLVMSADEVTKYTLTLYAAQIGVNASAMIVNAAVPGIGGLIGTREFARARRVRGELMSVLWLFMLVLGCGVLLLNASFVALWVGRERFCGSGINLLMVLAIAQQVAFRADAFLIDATLNMRRKVLAGCVAAVVGIAAACILGKRYGLAGIIMGQMLGRSVLSFYYPIIMSAALEGQSRGLLGAIWRPGLVMGALFYLAWRVGAGLVIESWPLLVLVAVPTVIVVFAAGYGLGFGHDQQAVIRERLSLARRFRS